MKNQFIALDCDGVLLDYHLAYAQAWQRAFGVFPTERDPNAYWPWDRWKVERLNGAPLSRFRCEFNEHFWTTMPALPGAVEACALLDRAGFELVCVSAIHPQFKKARFSNLRNLGFPISRLYATPVIQEGRNPKADVLNKLQPDAFVDDYAPYMSGLEPTMHCALIERGLSGSPNVGVLLVRDVTSIHVDLMAFTQSWLGRGA